MIKSPRQKGITLIYTAVIMVALMGVMSLAVDLGRVRTAKTELQNAVDAATRYAVTGISDSTTLAKAQSAALENTVDGTPLVLTAADVEIGTWNSSTREFTVGGSTPDAIRVTGRRTAARGNAISLAFAPVIGKSSFDVTATAIARLASTTPAYDIVGLSNVTLSGGTQIRRWSSESGTVNVATNGTSSVPWGCYIYGNMYHRASVPSEPGNGITGTSTAMAANLSYPAATAPGGATNLGAVNVANGATYTLAAGNYTCTSITLGGGATINVTGDVNVYCSGTVTIGNGVTLNTSGTTNQFILYLTSNNTANFNMSSAFYMTIYGPSATLNLSGSSPMIGACVVNSLNLVGSASISYSSVMAAPNGSGGGGSGGGAITTVK